jgi:predicted membrane protein
MLNTLFKVLFLIGWLACSRVHRRLGIIAMIAATLVAFSTLFTKQHYVMDVVAGVFLAFVAYGVFLKRYPSDQVSELDRRVAPALALCVGAVVAVGLATSWLAYAWGGETQFTFGP